MSALQPEETREFMRLYSSHSRQIYSFIRSLVPNQADAEELYQEASATLWEKFAQFEPGTNFRAWAFQVAHYKVLNYRQKQSRSALVFSDRLVESLQESALSVGDRADVRFRALADCYRKLKQQDRELVDARYHEEGSIASVSEKSGRSVDYVYKALRRIHATLYHCINTTLAE